MIEKNLVKRSIFIIAIVVLLEWKKSLKYKPDTYPYKEMSETEVWNEYEKNPDFRVIDQNFTILKRPNMEDHKITLLIKSAPGKPKYFYLAQFEKWYFFQTVLEPNFQILNFCREYRQKSKN